MNSLESILNGIKNSDWGLVIDGYYQMTGQKVEKPQDTVESLLKRALTKVSGESHYVERIANQQGPTTEEEALNNEISNENQSYLPKKRTARRPKPETCKLNCNECKQDIDVDQNQFLLNQREDQRFICDECMPKLRNRLKRVN